MKKETINCILENKIIVIVRGLEKEKILPAAQALYDGGIRLIEVTFDQTGKSTMQETAEAIRSLCEVFDGRLCVGAGTVLNLGQAEAAFSAGARYLISPSTDTGIIVACKRYDIVSIPGAITPTEIAAAYNSGADLVKLFPAGNFGPDYVKAIRAPLNHIPMLAVGGVDQFNIRKYLDCGICGVGIGSNIVKSEYINQGRYDEIRRLARTYVEAIQ
jgi:2-dehydro-3-deoxyphosphogluconate aldolase/(4S)-4-hydroxy-2-oxoglutarate aldolase